MPLKRTAALAVSGLVVLGGGAVALSVAGAIPSPSGASASASTAIASSASSDSHDPMALPSPDEVQSMLDDLTIDPETGAIDGHGFTVQPPTVDGGTATISGTGPDGEPHTATIAPGVDGSWPRITIDGHDLGSMIEQFRNDHPESSKMPDLPSISIPSPVQDFLDRARDVIGGVLGDSSRR